MSDLPRSSKVYLQSDNKVVIVCNSSEQISATVLLFGAAPAVLSLIAAIFTYHLKLESITIALLLLTFICLAFFLSITSVHLQAKQKLNVSRDGITEVRYTILGPRSIVFNAKEIAYIKAIIEGWDQVQLCLQTTSNTRRTLFTVPIDTLDDFTDRITRLLKKDYIATVQCSSVICPMTPVEKPDFISFDKNSKLIRCDMPDNRQLELPFVDVDTIEALGQREAAGSLLDDSSSAVEYVCEPVVCMKDGTIYVLQRFFSTEDTLTPTSHAYINASKTADYLRNFIATR